MIQKLYLFMFRGESKEFNFKIGIEMSYYTMNGQTKCIFCETLKLAFFRLRIFVSVKRGGAKD